MRGEVPVAGLLRLREVLSSDVGVVGYTLTGRMDDQGRLLLSCDILGVLELVCQRCLGSLSWPLALAVKLQLMPAGSVLPDVAEEADSVDIFPVDGALDVLALVEDEILLALPIAPMHVPTECGAAGHKTVAGGRENPFSALAALKSR